MSSNNKLLLSLLMDGYCILNNVVSKRTITEFEALAVNLKMNKAPVNTSKTAWFWGAKDELAPVTQEMDEILSSRFNQYFDNEPIMLRAWLRSNPPGYVGSKWHQDTSIHYIPLPVIFAVPLCDVDTKAGPLYLCPRTQYLPHPTYNREEKKSQVKIELFKGDVLVFLSSVWHRGGANNTNAYRNIAFLEYTTCGYERANYSLDEYQKNTAEFN